MPRLYIWSCLSSTDKTAIDGGHDKVLPTSPGLPADGGKEDAVYSCTVRTVGLVVREEEPSWTYVGVGALTGSRLWNCF